MKIRILILLLFFVQLCVGQRKINISTATSSSSSKTFNTSGCNNWLSVPSYPSFAQAGQVNITGNKITVEATIYRTGPLPAQGLLYDGDIVSKHESPADVNYLLRPNTAEITTTGPGGGYFRTPDICRIELNKSYHLAMVYDGTTLKFYRNGFLMSQTPASGNLFQNNWRTEIGYYQSQFVNTNFVGYINEVRIWNIARTQADLNTYMNTSLPSPTTQAGLVAYYTFDNLLNKQGNPAYNATLSGAASINSIIPDCSFTPDSCAIKVVNTLVIPSFTAPDTVCVNTPVNITNTSTGATNYFWNFCVAGINSTPTAQNLGNPGGFLSEPVFSDFVQENGNYYAFVVNHLPGGLVRLDFGNSMINTPVATFLGNPSGAMNPTNGGNEGIQVVKNEGKWYAIITGGNPIYGPGYPRIIKIEFGSNIANNSPTGTNWGNLGILNEPIDLHVFQDNGIWYGFTVNAESNTITKFNFTSSFNNTPTAVNLGNIGGLNYPTGIFAANDAGNWRVFVCNGKQPYSLTRLDFGNSLLNAPVGTNLGNPGNVLGSPRDFTILRLCDEIAGFAVNGVSNDLVKFDFHNDLSSVPTGSTLGNTGNLNFPHSISKFFRAGNDLYTLITNVNNNTITRLQFAGCNTASIASSALQTPPPVTYSTPGTYNINLSVDEGLATQSSFCKQVVVMPALIHSPLQKMLSCNTDSIKIGTPNKQASYSWNTGAVTDSIYVKNNGTYWVTSSRFGCENTDSFTVTLEKIAAKTNNDTVVCAGKTVQLNVTAGTASTYSWTPATGLSSSIIANPAATPQVNTLYIVTAKTAAGCTAKDSVLISVNPNPVIKRTNDTTVCHNKTIQLNASGGNSYTWLPSSSLSNTAISNPVVSPVANTTYYVTVTNSSNCSSSDSVKVAVKPAPVFTVSSGLAVCKGTAVQLNAGGGDLYKWDPVDGLTNPAIANPFAAPAISSIYTVKIIETTCKDSASLTTYLTVLPLPVVTAKSSNDVDCSKPASQLTASGALKYNWQPFTGLNDSTISSPLASPSGTTLYVVKGTDLNGCSNYDSVYVKVTHAGDLLVNLPNAFTPNGDGKNDCFGVSRYAGLLQHVELSVYNRWGVKVFTTTNPLNCWDGRYQGKMQDAGGFVYILRASTFCGEIFKKGIVMLVH